MNDTHKQVIRWLAKGDVGESSRCMAMWLAFRQETDGSYPYDPDDMYRCMALLRQVPALRDRLGEMAEVSPVWAAFAARWDEIEATLLDEAGVNWSKSKCARDTYNLMKSVERSASERPYR